MFQYVYNLLSFIMLKDTCSNRYVVCRLFGMAVSRWEVYFEHCIHTSILSWLLIFFCKKERCKHLTIHTLSIYTPDYWSLSWWRRLLKHLLRILKHIPKTTSEVFLCGGCPSGNAPMPGCCVAGCAEDDRILAASSRHCCLPCFACVAPLRLRPMVGKVS